MSKKEQQKAAQLLREAHIAEQQGHQNLMVFKDNPNPANDRCWDELERLYQNSVMLLNMHVNSVGILRNEEIKKRIRNPQQVAELIHILTNDLSKLSGELAEIHALHAGKTGSSKDENELIHSFKIGEMYQLFAERHTAVVLPTSNQILEETSLAEQQWALDRENAKAQEQASDPSHTAPIDVPFQEVTPQ